MWIITWSDKTIRERTKKGTEMFIRILKENDIVFTVKRERKV